MRLHRLIFVFLLLLACCVSTGLAQVLTSSPHVGVEQVPLGDEVYPFLRHLSVRGFIVGFSEAELPISEYEVAGFLRQAQKANLSRAENELLNKYLRTFAHEPSDIVTMFPDSGAEPLFTGGIFTDKDKYLYQWSNDSTKSDLFVHGIGSVEIRHKTDPTSESVGLLNIGGRFSGSLSGEVGYFLQSTNGERQGNSELALEDPLLSKNNDLRYFSQQFYDFTTAEFTYTNDWFTGKIAREAVAIGGGYQNDNVILSANGVPTYDFFSIGAHIGAVRYKAMSGSLVNDSVAPGASYPLKFLTLHDLTFDVGRDFEMGFTDIMVFTQRYELGYLNPFSFLNTVKKGLDDQDKDNSLLGAHAQWNIAPGLEVRGQGLLDDLVGSRIGTGYWSNKSAWQFGAMWAGAFGISNLDWEAECIRVEPYTYSHWDTNGTYSTSKTLLGAQIGSNAISYWTMLRWAPSAKWTISLSAEFIERGENVYDSNGKLLYNAGADYRYSFTDSTSSFNDTHILNGRRVNIMNLTLDAEFEAWRGITFYLRGTKKSVDYLNESPVTPGFNLDPGIISKAPLELPETIVAFGIQALI